MTSNRSTCYVALDLGSDSMSAYADVGSTSEPIRLQEYAHKYSSDAEVLRASDGTLSPRLPTRIYLRTVVPWRQLPAVHAGVTFLKRVGDNVECEQAEVNRSIFIYFQKPLSGIDVMPNPKLAFQMASEEAVPVVRLPGQGAVPFKFDPADLVSHLTVQVINNLILASSALAGVSLEQIHLLLTVPNVYSPVHTRQIQEAVAQHIKVKSLQLVYESDALAHYLFDTNADENTRRFRNNVVQPHDRNLREARILTLDIGRGTTDVSIVSIERAPTGGRQKHTVLARTGVCSGGQALTYIFVKFFNERLIAEMGKIGQELKFDFLRFSAQHRDAQWQANQTLENYVDAIKVNIDENFQVALADDSKEQLISQVGRALTSETGAIADDPATEGRSAAFQRAVRNALLLPADLRSLRELAASLVGYIKLNVDHMVDYVESMAQAREVAQVHGVRDYAPVFDERTFVVVGGQASQFKPLKAAVRKRFSGTGVATANVHFLEGEEAKNACARGALSFARSNSLELNQHEFFGTYGFLASATPLGFEPFSPISTTDLIRKDATVAAGLAQTDYHLVYVVRPVDRPDDANPDGTIRPPRLNDGFTAPIVTVRPLGARVSVEHDSRTYQLTLKGVVAPAETISVTSVTTHGYVNDDLHPKIWPVVIKDGRTGA